MPNTIADNLARLQAARTAIAGAITEMGGTVNQGDGYEEFPADIRTIVSSDFEATLQVTAVAGATVTATKTGKTFAGTCNAQGVATLNIISPGTYTVQSSYSGAFSDTQSVAIITHQQTYTVTNTFIVLNLTAPDGSDVTITDGTTTITDTGTDASKTYYLPNIGTWTLTAELNGETASKTLVVSGYQTYTETLAFIVSHIYGFKVSKADSNPATRVTYLYDAVGMTPAAMNYSTGTFDYGGWADAWFITGNKPVALNFDGTEDYELNPNDYTKKLDGTASDITSTSSSHNFMARIPKCYVKRWEDNDYRYCAISDTQVDSDYKAYAHDAGDGTINDYFYAPMFKGYIADSKMRSLSGVTPTVNTTGSNEKTAAEACGSGWQLWDWAKHELIADLLTLISCSTNSQASFGNGYVGGSAATATGGSGSGQFWGASDNTHHVKVFHIEDFWGNRFDRCLGINLSGGKYSYKMVRPYALEPDSTYTETNISAPSSNYISDGYYSDYGFLPKTTSGSDSTYECDYFYSNLSGVLLGLFGGRYGSGLGCGSRCLGLYSAALSYGSFVGGSPCFNPPHEGV